MSKPHPGRPRAFDREKAVLAAARLFWESGYSGTSTRALTHALGISTSSLYAAFGSKAGLFEEAVKTYAERYRDIYRQAVGERDILIVVDRILTHSVHEFTQAADHHPGCLVASAVLADSAETIDVHAYIADLHQDNERTLLARIQRAAEEGQLPADASVSALTGLVQAVWHGLSVQSNLGVSRDELLAAADLAIRQFARRSSATASPEPT